MGQVLPNGCGKHDAKYETHLFLSNNSNNIEEAVVAVEIRENNSQIISPRRRGLEQSLVQKERWINNSSSYQKILVGEGDFSFSNSLAMAFGSATDMVATSLDSRDTSIGCEKHDAKDQTPLFLSNSNEIEEEEEAEVGVEIRENTSQIISPRARGLEQLLVQKERWINHYSSNQKILLVGEGDFSFSNSLAMAFGSATNMVATSLDSRGFLSTNYKKVISNIQNLLSRGCMVMNGVDATEMATYFWLQGSTFDRVVFNFPHSGIFRNESRNSQLSQHRRLVRLFLENAKKMIRDGGEIHITHKCNGFFLEWNLELLAWECGLCLIEVGHFNFTDYPGYRTKYGFGGDNNFNCNPSKTYKFGFGM